MYLDIGFDFSVREECVLGVFDLDNTLHNASAHIFPQIHLSMMAYICRHLHVDEAEATRWRQTYWKRYGATLLGLVKHHAVDAAHFLHHRNRRRGRQLA